MRDASLTTYLALPAAGATAETASLDLGARGYSGTTRSGTLPPNTELLVIWPALPNLTNGGYITFTVQDSANDTDFADLHLESSVVGTVTGGAAGSKRHRLPPNTRQYVHLKMVASADAGNNTGSIVTFAVDVQT